MGDGAGNCEEDLAEAIRKLLAEREGWLVYNTHGLDEEGWGPIGAEYLERLLGRLVEMEGVEVMPAGGALAGAPAD